MIYQSTMKVENGIEKGWWIILNHISHEKESFFGQHSNGHMRFIYYWVIRRAQGIFQDWQNVGFEESRRQKPLVLDHPNGHQTINFPEVYGHGNVGFNKGKIFLFKNHDETHQWSKFPWSYIPMAIRRPIWPKRATGCPVQKIVHLKIWNIMTNKLLDE